MTTDRCPACRSYDKTRRLLTNTGNGCADPWHEAKRRTTACPSCLSSDPETRYTFTSLLGDKFEYIDDWHNTDPCTCTTSESCGALSCPHPEVHGGTMAPEAVEAYDLLVAARERDDWRQPLRDLLDDAGRFVTSDRSDAYGRPRTNHQCIAAFWAVVDEHASDTMPPEGKAALKMLLVKVARLLNTPTHLDSIVDIPGYALVYADCVRGDA